MTNFYEKYKNLRKDQKIDLTDIQNRTKINIKYLEAIESGNFDLIHDPYTNLFFRAYINEIGADADVAISELSEYLLKNENSKSQETDNIDNDKTKSDEVKTNISVPSEKKNIDNHDSSFKKNKKTDNNPTAIPLNLIKGILFLVFWVIVIILIRNITLENKNEIANINTDHINDNITNYIDFQQIQADFLETSSLQTAIEQSLPLIVKIVSKNTLAIVSIQDSLEANSFPITSGDQKTYSFENNLDILLNHSEGVTIFVNGDALQDIRSQKTPVRLIFSVDPKSVTIKHYSEVG